MKISRLTIRARITGGSLVIAVLISVVAGIVIYSQVQRIISDDQHAVLENVEASYLAALSGSVTDDVDPPGPDQLVAVVDPRGDAAVNTLPDPLATQLAELVARSGETREVSAGGLGYLVRVSPVETSEGTWEVVTASSTEVTAQLLNQVAWLLIASIAGINIAFGAASWFIGTAALAPVGRLRRSAEGLVTTGESELLPVGPAEDEIAELARTLNRLIAELRASAERERQIVSDASHEFRTPLAILQTQLELAQAESSSLPQMQADVAAARRTLARLSSLATSMLELSRLDAQVDPGTATLAELAGELADAADRGRQRVGARDIRIDFASDDGPVETTIISIGVADFGRLVDNLVSNALAVMPGGGAIVLTLESLQQGVRLRVADDGGGMDPDFVPHAFDRFSRADSARTGGGAGLGLSIVAGIVAVAGGTATLDNRPGSGLTVEIVLPHDPREGRPGRS